MSEPSLSNAFAWPEQGALHSSCSLAFQPVFNLSGEREVVAFEALLRVSRHGRLEGPVELIAQAEEDGSIVDIDRWVLSQVITMLKSRPRLRVWINTSQLSIAHPTFVDDALRALITHQIAGRIALEVTETADVDVRTLSRRLEVLRCRALTVMLDDVRDGFAKRSLIVSHAVSGCKLSRESTRELMVSAKARAEVVRLVKRCRNLGKQVVLEGIETEEELQLAHQLGITLAQGYLLGRPAHPEQLQQYPEMRPI